MNASNRQSGNRPPAGIRRQRGVTMMEVLVSVLVLAIGLMGMAALQSASLRYNHSAYLRTVSNNLAYDMADRMRANRDAALDGDYDIAYADAAPTGATVAEEDVAEWRADITQTLPSSSGEITVDAATGVATIGIRWDDSRGEEAAAAFEMRTQL